MQILLTRLALTLSVLLLLGAAGLAAREKLASRRACAARTSFLAPRDSLWPTGFL